MITGMTIIGSIGALAFSVRIGPQMTPQANETAQAAQLHSRRAVSARVVRAVDQRGESGGAEQ